MACMKLGSKSDAFQRQGQAWFCTTGLPSDIVVEVGDMSFHLHKFPLLSRSGVMERSIAEASQQGDDDDKCLINIPDLPGGDKTFELIAKFCYGVKLELTASNVVYLRCAAEHLQMTEEHGEGNLISQTETFFNRVVLRSWKDSIKALQTCSEVGSHYAEELNITKKCIESLAARASSTTDPNLFGWPVVEPMQSPGGGVLWNGISTGARVNNKHTSSDWWYEDASTLTFPLFKRLIVVMDSRSVREDIIAVSGRFSTTPMSSGSVLSEEEQKHLLEEILELLPVERGLVPTKFFVDVLRVAKILKASPSCHHPWLAEGERENLCRLLDCQKLSLEACTHAAQNERLPLRVIVQVLFFEQLQLRTSVAGCFLVSDNLDGGSRQLRSGGFAGGGGSSTEGGGWATAVRENQVLKVGMDSMRMRVCELEKECSNMRQEIEKLGGGKTTSKVGGGGKTWENVSKRLGFGIKLKSHQMCSAQEGSVSKSNSENVKIEKLKDVKERRGQHKKASSIISSER
ncbi:BTB/POZ domain-containing protein [Raphanus sativus]|nr:BTB/POZ domain-containing protein [Raphanus sativus]